MKGNASDEAQDVADPDITQAQWNALAFGAPIILAYNKTELARINSVREAVEYWMFKGTPGRRLRDMKVRSVPLSLPPSLSLSLCLSLAPGGAAARHLPCLSQCSA